MSYPYSYSYAVHQLKPSPSTFGLTEPIDDFAISFEELSSKGMPVLWENYDHVYTGTFKSSDSYSSCTLDSILAVFADRTPCDFSGDPISVGDIITVDGFCSAYVDKDRFVGIDDFSSYRYFIDETQFCLEDYPSFDSGNNYISSSDAISDRYFLGYKMPLADDQVSDYGLTPSSDNPGGFQFPPVQAEAQIKLIGEWEDKFYNKDRRLTYKDPVSESFSLKDTSLCSNGTLLQFFGEWESVNTKNPNHRLTCRCRDTGSFKLKNLFYADRIKPFFDTIFEPEPIEYFNSSTFDKSSYASMINDSKPASTKKPVTCRPSFERP